MPNIYIYIPREDISKIIGLKGKNIKSIEREHKVTSRIFKEIDPFPKQNDEAKNKNQQKSLWTAMMICGTATSVFGACQAVADKVDEIGDVVIEYEMNKEKRHLFFQNGGLPIKQISAQTDCRINVPVLDGPVQLECSNLTDANAALKLVLAHAGIVDESNKSHSNNTKRKGEQTLEKYTDRQKQNNKQKTKPGQRNNNNKTKSKAGKNGKNNTRNMKSRSNTESKDDGDTKKKKSGNGSRRRKPKKKSPNDVKD